MSKEEITAGIKNAIERGYSLELAKQSFINAGYSKNDVEDSSAAITGIIARIPSIPQFSQPQQNQQKPQISQPQQIQQKPQISQPQQIQQKKQTKLKIIIIILLLIFILLITGLLATIFFKEQVSSLLAKIGIAI